MTERREMLQRLDRLGTREFWSCTLIASTWNVVHSVLSSTEEVRWLAAHADQSVPEVLERMRTRYMSDPELIACFVVLEQAGDPRAVPAIVRYVESLPAVEKSYAYMVARLTGDSAYRSPEHMWHPFIYAMRALDRLSALGLFEPGSSPNAWELFLRRREIASAARERFEQMSGRQHPEDPPRPP